MGHRNHGNLLGPLMLSGAARSPNRGLLVCFSTCFASGSARFLLRGDDDENLAHFGDANEGLIGSNACDRAGAQQKRELLHTIKHNWLYGRNTDTVYYMGQAS